jgi:hypothetical protein
MIVNVLFCVSALAAQQGLNTDRGRLEPAAPRLPFTGTRTLTVKYSHALTL